MSAVIRRATIVGGLMLTTGCYSYTSVIPAQVAPGTRVGVDLTTRASAEYTEQFGATVDRVEGLLLSATPDSARLQVERARQLGGGWSYWARETVSLPLAASSGWQRRAFSGRRTAIATGGLILLGIQIWKGGLIGFGGHDSDPQPRPLPPVNPG